MRKKAKRTNQSLRTLICVVFFVSAIMLTALLTAVGTYQGLRHAYTKGVISFLDKKGEDVVNLLEEARDEARPVTIEEALQNIQIFKKTELKPEENFLNCSQEPFEGYAERVSNKVLSTTVYNSKTLYLTPNTLKWDEKILKTFGKNCVDGVGATYPLKIVMDGNYILWGSTYCGGIKAVPGDDEYLMNAMCEDASVRIQKFLKK